MAAQALREPEAVRGHRRHAVDADHVGPRRQGQPEGLVPAQEGAVQQPHLVPCLLQAGGDVGHAERRETEAGPVERAAEEGVDEQDGGHRVRSILTL